MLTCLRSQNMCKTALLGGKKCEEVSSWLPKCTFNCIQCSNGCLTPFLGAKTLNNVPSWEPKSILKPPLGSQSDLLGTKMCT